MATNAAIQSAASLPPAEWFDDDNFLIDAEVWNRQIAQQIAHSEGVGPLTNKHWEIIEHVRKRYFLNGSLPVMRLVCRAAGLDRHKAHMFFGSCRSLWRVAGLPNPGEEAKSYMG